LLCRRRKAYKLKTVIITCKHGVCTGNAGRKRVRGRDMGEKGARCTRGEVTVGINGWVGEKNGVHEN
jgi:hypothetical protein